MSYSEAEFNAQVEYLQGLIKEQRDRAERAEALISAPAQSSQVRLATIEECARVAEEYPSSGSATEHPVEYWIRALAAQPPAAPVETDALGVIESDRLFAEQILADFGAFEEGITDKEKLAQWIRNVRRASSTPDDPPLQSSSAERAQALRLLMAEDERQSKLHDLLETIREQIRTGVEPEHRPGGLFKNIQDAVYAMRGRTRLMDDGAITKIFDGQQEARKPPIETTGNGTGNGRTIKPELTGSPSGTPHGAGVFVPPAGRWVVGKNGWDASDEATREDI